MNFRNSIMGFLPWRGPLVIDVIVVAMVFVLMTLCFSLFLVKFRKRYHRHKVIQLCIAGVLLALLVVFEIDLQYFENWRERAHASPYFDVASGRGLVIYTLWIHLLFATTTLALWFLIIVRALNQFPNPPRPNQHSGYHSRWGMVAAIDMVLTAVSGWVFYVLAFVA
jgi:putative membrane protein